MGRSPSKVKWNQYWWVERGKGNRRNRVKGGSVGKGENMLRDC